MELFNLLEISIPIFTQTYSVELNFIGKFIGWLVKIVGNVGIGIVLFSLALKLVTLPFDIYQRISMRKQNLKMKQNQERMEKLQKQYANDKEMYNQKVMEMYKENGISMFSSCLPMILSLVIFFVAINAFNAYSSYSNLENYNTMVNAYNEQLLPYSADITEENVRYVIELTDKKNADGTLVTDESGNAVKEPTGTITYWVEDNDLQNEKFFYYKALYKAAEGEITQTAEGYAFAYDYQKAKAYLENADKAYYIYEAKVLADADRKAALDSKAAELKGADAELTDEKAMAQAIVEYFTSPAQTAVKTAYETKVKQNTDFFWIKNIWVTDAAYKHPIMDYDTFTTEIAERNSCTCSTKSNVKGIAAYTKEGYNLVTGQLGTYKNQANGYFILIALSIGTILLQQFVSMRSQKEQQKYSSVDGQAAGQQKMMMVVMTGMFAIFSFMYSSAFSIYLIVSNLFSLLSTLVINKFVDKAAEKREAKAEMEKYNKRFPGRVQAAQNAGKDSAKNKRNKNAKK